MLATVDRDVFGDQGPVLARDEIVERLIPYAEQHVAKGGRLNNITRHILGLYHGEPGARTFRRILSEKAVGPRAGVAVLRDARQAVAAARQPPDAALRESTAAGQ
jgi:tRNA-dihydrouridine synthase A